MEENGSNPKGLLEERLKKTDEEDGGEEEGE